ncbi:MAG: hypothetical protein WAX77_02565 [Methylococcaceae bacterium]
MKSVILTVSCIFLALSSNVYAGGTQAGGNSKMGNFTSDVTVDNVTQVTIGNKNESEMAIGGISSRGTLKMGDFKSSVHAKNITQATIGNNNSSSLALGGIVNR